MFKARLLALAASLSLITSAAQSAPESINLRTKNFPPYDLAVDGKNFARCTAWLMANWPYRLCGVSHRENSYAAPGSQLAKPHKDATHAWTLLGSGQRCVAWDVCIQGRER